MSEMVVGGYAVDLLGGGGRYLFVHALGKVAVEMTKTKTCKTCEHRTDRLIKGLCALCYQKIYQHERKLSSTTRAPKTGMTKAQAKARAMKFKYKPHDIQRWSYDQIIKRWERIEI